MVGILSKEEENKLLLEEVEFLKQKIFDYQLSEDQKKMVTELRRLRIATRDSKYDYMGAMADVDHYQEEIKKLNDSFLLKKKHLKEFLAAINVPYIYRVEIDKWLEENV